MSYWILQPWNKSHFSLGCRSFLSNADGRNLSTKAGLTTFIVSDVFESSWYWEKNHREKRTKNSCFFYHYTNFVLFSIKTKSIQKMDWQTINTNIAPVVRITKKDELRFVFEGPLHLFWKVILLSLPQRESFPINFFLLRKTTR